VDGPALLGIWWGTQTTPAGGVAGVVDRDSASGGVKPSALYVERTALNGRMPLLHLG